jgi:hypothetical protein
MRAMAHPPSLHVGKDPQNFCLVVDEFGRAQAYVEVAGVEKSSAFGLISIEVDGSTRF